MFKKPKHVLWGHGDLDHDNTRIGVLYTANKQHKFKIFEAKHNYKVFFYNETLSTSAFPAQWHHRGTGCPFLYPPPPNRLYFLPCHFLCVAWVGPTQS